MEFYKAGKAKSKKKTRRKPEDLGRLRARRGRDRARQEHRRLRKEIEIRTKYDSTRSAGWS
jgi:hypothetical protein